MLCGVWLMGLAAQACSPAPCTCVIQLPQQNGSPSAFSAAQTSSTTPGVGTGSPSNATDTSPSNLQLIWDGDTVGQGAKGWADCEKKPKCISSLAASAGAGKNASVGLSLHIEGAGWLGAGWNVFGWWPQDAGVDISGHKTLQMDVRIESKSAAIAPDLQSFNVALKCSTSKDKCLSDPAVVAQFIEGSPLDGQWHHVRIPLSRMTAKAGFNPSKVWEVEINTWSDSPKNFTLYFDNIGFGD